MKPLIAAMGLFWDGSQIKFSLINIVSAFSQGREVSSSNAALMTTDALQLKTPPVYFRLTYITSNFLYGDVEIKVSDPERGMEIIYKQRPKDSDRPPYETNDGLIVALCQRSLSERLYNETVSTGILSQKKEAVKQIFDDMTDFLQRTLRLARWRTNIQGGPNPIRSGVPDFFVWSVNGSNWKMVTDSISLRVKFLHSTRNWSKEDAGFLQTEILKGLNEPLAHELLREADINRESNPRSSLILGVAAAEVGFKHFASKTLPDTTWLLELPSPPLIEMINKFPWAQLKTRINDKVPMVPEPITDELKKAVALRNKIVHSGIATLNYETLDSVMNAVNDFLYFLDLVHTGQPWPLSCMSRDILGHFKKD